MIDGTGGTGTRIQPAPTAASADAAVGLEAGSTESRIIDAVVACAGRWGIDKTTVDDVANEARVSRATVYRLFPGGKPAMVQTATRREVVALLHELTEGLDAAPSLRDALIEAISGGAAALAGQPALDYMRRHDPAAVRAFLSFERLDMLFGLTGDLLAPSLHRFLDPAASREAVIWAARLIVSDYLHPDARGSLSERDLASLLVDQHLLPGLSHDIQAPIEPTRSVQPTRTEQYPRSTESPDNRSTST